MSDIEHVRICSDQNMKVKTSERLEYPHFRTHFPSQPQLRGEISRNSVFMSSKTSCKESIKIIPTIHGSRDHMIYYMNILP